jgi:hypothetical protein
LVVSDSVGAVHDVGTNDCAARWKIQSGRTRSSVSRVEDASRRSHSSSVMRSRKCSMFSVRLRQRWMPYTLAIGACQQVIGQVAAGETVTPVIKTRRIVVLDGGNAGPSDGGGATL